MKGYVHLWSLAVTGPYNRNKICSLSGTIWDRRKSCRLKHTNRAGWTYHHFRDNNCNRFCYDAKYMYDAKRRVWWTRFISVFTERSKKFKFRYNHTTNAPELFRYADISVEFVYIVQLHPHWVTNTRWWSFYCNPKPTKTTYRSGMELILFVCIHQSKHSFPTQKPQIMHLNRDHSIINLLTFFVKHSEGTLSNFHCAIRTITQHNSTHTYGRLLARFSAGFQSVSNYSTLSVHNKSRHLFQFRN